MTFTPKFKDIFDYVTRKTDVDPIEKALSKNRFEVFDTCILDTETKDIISQSVEFVTFSSNVGLLRARLSEFGEKYLTDRVKELSELPPFEIKLENG